LLARNQNNVSEWSDMSTRGLLFQWISTSSHWKLTCSRHDYWYSWTIAKLALNNNHSLTHYIYYRYYKCTGWWKSKACLCVCACLQIVCLYILVTPKNILSFKSQGYNTRSYRCRERCSLYAVTVTRTSRWYFCCYLENMILTIISLSYVVNIYELWWYFSCNMLCYIRDVCCFLN